MKNQLVEKLQSKTAIIGVIGLGYVGLPLVLSYAQVVSLESTTYPGTTQEELLPRIEQMVFKVGQDIFLVYSPEREDPGNPNYTTQTIPKVCSDPHIPTFPKIRNFSFDLTSTDLTEQTIANFDAVLLATDHDGFDYQLISQHANC